MLTLLFMLAIQAPMPQISVFVMPHRVVDPSGFSEPVPKGTTDSVRDLQNEIRKKRKTLAVATSKDTADIILIVQGRGIDAQLTGGAIALPVGRGVMAQPTYSSANVVRTVMIVGDYQRPITAEFSGIGDVWGECAEQITKDLDRWVAANKDKLLERRQAK